MSHPDRKTLDKFLRGELSASANREVARHILLGCQRCQELATRILPEIDRALGTHSSAGETKATRQDYADSFERVRDLAREEERRLEEDRNDAPRLLESLLQQPPARQLLLIRNSRRFRSWALCELIQERARAEGFQEPERAVQLAELALAVAKRVDPDDHGPRLVCDLQARCWAVLANARRIISDLPASERAFRIAESLLREGTGDPLEEARILAMKAVLRSDQRRFDETLSLLDRTLEIYRRTGQRRSLGQALIRKGTALGEAGEPGEAIRFLREGAELIDPVEDRRWTLVAKHNLILYLSDLGEVEEALQLLNETRPLYAEMGETMSLLRLRWLEGRLAQARGDLEEAEAAYQEVQDAFIARSLGLDAALATLDLATVYLASGRTAELKRVAAEMIPIFESLEVHREAVAAMLAVRRAVEMERVTMHLLRDVSGFLEKSRQDPRLRFQASR